MAGEPSSALALVTPLSMVFGGCCANAWSLEQLVSHDARIGSALTVVQMAFIVAHSAPAALGGPRAVPLRAWGTQVLVLSAMSLLNNWVFFYAVPITVQIVFRSAGLLVSMAFNYAFNGKRYSLTQIASVALVTGGVIVATLSRPASAKGTPPPDPRSYFIGILILTACLVLAGILGLLQERTFAVYGPHWREGLFYTHAFSLPLFVFLPGVRKSMDAMRGADMRVLLPVALFNVLTQSACVAGVNQLMSRVSSVSTNLALTTRKALSLCISVWYFGSGWNAQLGIGAALVGVGTLLYAYASQPSNAKGAGAEKIKKE